MFWGFYGAKVHCCLIFCFCQVLRLRGGGPGKRQRYQEEEKQEVFIPTIKDITGNA